MTRPRRFATSTLRAPWFLYQILRDKGPVVHVPALQGWVITQHAHAVTVPPRHRHDAMFCDVAIPRNGLLLIPFGLLNRDPDMFVDLAHAVSGASLGFRGEAARQR